MEAQERTHTQGGRAAGGVRGGGDGGQGGIMEGGHGQEEVESGERLTHGGG